MGQKVKLKEPEATVAADGWYTSQIAEGTIDNGKYGEQIRLIFLFKNEKGEVKDRRDWFTPTKNPKSKLSALAGCLGLSLESLEEVDLDLLVNRYVLIRLQTQTTGAGQTVQRIVQYAPAQVLPDVASEVEKAARKAREAPPASNPVPDGGPPS